MRRAGAGLLTVGACLFAIGCCAPAAVGAPTPHGQLTAQEYTLLGSAQSALKRALSGHRPNWTPRHPKQLGDENKLATSTDKLSSDMALMVNIVAGGAPPSKLNQARVNADVNVFQRYVNLVLSANSPDDLAVCPHA